VKLKAKERICIQFINDRKWYVLIAI